MYNIQTGQSDIHSLEAAIDDDVKFDPLFSAMIKGLGHAIDTLDEQRTKEQSEESEEATDYVREVFDFHSGEFQAALNFANEYFVQMHAMSAEQRKEDPRMLVKFLNALATISDCIVNIGLTYPGDFPDEPDLATVSTYFEQVRARADFSAMFLQELGMQVQLRPLYTKDDPEGEFSAIRQPILVITREGKEYDFTLAPCHIYMPDWYILLTQFYAKSNELLEDARIALEDIDVVTVEEVLEEHRSGE